MIQKIFDEKSAATHTGTGINSNSDSENQQLAEELHKPIIRKFKKYKVYTFYKDNIWGADLADIQLMNKYNNRIGIVWIKITTYSKRRVSIILWSFSS